MQLQPAGPTTNQVTFEGHVVRALTHSLDRFLRPTNQGGLISQSNMVILYVSRIDETGDQI